MEPPALHDPDLSVHQLENLIKHDAALCYRILRTVNSAAFALRMTVHSIREALVLGTPRLVTALAPALVRNERVNLKKLELELAKVGLEKRLGWVTQLYPQLEQVVGLPDPLEVPANEDPTNAAVYASQLAFLGAFDRFYSSEPAYESRVRSR